MFDRVPDHVLTMPRERAGDFLVFFARFEFSLKACGYIHTNRGVQEANFLTFADAIEHGFKPENGSSIDMAVKYLRAQPPKQPVFSSEGVTWVSRVPTGEWAKSDVREILFFVRGVRNNFVHGAKFLTRESEERSRDQDLVQAALCVLNECLRISPRVYRAFDSEVL